jgi:hypothetical protein
MANFKPQLLYMTNQSVDDYYAHRRNSEYIRETYTTYVELKKDLPRVLAETNEAYISVYRSRRGEWGEWGETWGLIDNKPKIIKQGWQ